MQKQQELLEQQKLKMQEQHRMEKEIMENERLEQIKNKKDGEQSEWLLLWPLTLGGSKVKVVTPLHPPYLAHIKIRHMDSIEFLWNKNAFQFQNVLGKGGGRGVMIVKF